MSWPRGTAARGAELCAGSAVGSPNINLNRTSKKAAPCRALQGHMLNWDN